jgi:UDP-N-acetylglucosamine:LPS N-acetylglucosamine transferase
MAGCNSKMSTPKTKKIAYLFSRAGGGHVAALRALKFAIKDLKGEDAFIHIEIDIWNIGGKIQNALWGAKSYAFILKYIPFLNGILFRLFNIKFLTDLSIQLNYPNLGKNLRKLILDESPDLIISVHPMANPLIVKALKDLRLFGKIPIVNVITELINIHRLWVAPEFDLTFVATEEARQKCIEYGCPSPKIKLIGIPVDPKFLKAYPEKGALRKEMGLSPDKFTILIMGGAEGFGGIFGQVRALNELGKDFQVIVIAGRNAKLYKRLERERARFKFQLKIYGFTWEVPKIMHASDLLITKAGPQTIVEAIASELPLISTSYIPGQEEPIPEWIERKGIGRYITNPRKVVKVIKELIEKNELKKMKENIRKIKNPRVTYEIVENILNLACR